MPSLILIGVPHKKTGPAWTLFVVVVVYSCEIKTFFYGTYHGAQYNVSCGTPCVVKGIVALLKILSRVWAEAQNISERVKALERETCSLRESHPNRCF